jgi:hypothetical protein
LFEIVNSHIDRSGEYGLCEGGGGIVRALYGQTFLYRQKKEYRYSVCHFTGRIYRKFSANSAEHICSDFNSQFLPKGNVNVKCLQLQNVHALKIAIESTCLLCIQKDVLPCFVFVWSP